MINSESEFSKNSPRPEQQPPVQNITDEHLFKSDINLIDDKNQNNISQLIMVEDQESEEKAS